MTQLFIVGTPMLYSLAWIAASIAMIAVAVGVAISMAFAVIATAMLLLMQPSLLRRLLRML